MQKSVKDQIRDDCTECSDTWEAVDAFFDALYDTGGILTTRTAERLTDRLTAIFDLTRQHFYEKPEEECLDHEKERA